MNTTAPTLSGVSKGLHSVNNSDIMPSGGVYAMVKGRSTKVVGVRMPDGVYTRIKALADKQGLTVSEWCKVNLARSAGLLPDGEVRTHHKKR
ncbi:hypothetical protein ES705_12499 [subsurface metagenome]